MMYTDTRVVDRAYVLVIFIISVYSQKQPAADDDGAPPV